MRQAQRGDKGGAMPASNTARFRRVDGHGVTYAAPLVMIELSARV